MGLPQEVVDRIMDVLQDDTRTLKACSLTCKPMFASTRHLIHRTLCFSWENNRRIYALAENEGYTQGYHHGLKLSFLSFMGERDLLKYARHLDISVGWVFSPWGLDPGRLRHFPSLDRIHTLTIHWYYTVIWANVNNTYFTHIYPTLTTLVLRSPIGYYRFVLQFALQFPNLENLTLDSLQEGTLVWPGASVLPLVTKSPPLCGHLQFADLSPMDPVWTREFAFDLPNGINFRSVEFCDVHWKHGQPVLDGCAGSLEELTVHNVTNGERESRLRSFRVATTERIGSHLQITSN